MNVLGFDTSTAATAACVLREDGEAFEVVPSPSRLVGPPGHARELMPALLEVLEAAGLGFEEVDALAVGIGPGTFTGLRIGVATARAIAAARSLPVHPVSSLAALAAAADEPLRLATIDARRGELFAALYEGEIERWAPSVGTPSQLATRLREAALEPLAMGDGAVRFRDDLEAVGVRVVPDDSPLHVVRGRQVCRLAIGGPAVAPEAVLPAYLRMPDAVPQRQPTPS